eukprot:NODE_44_length_33449_cov_1.575742.p38 type:complete len:101 gc:universal NODE_44_length_33449_cov_1.575742:22003-21701(-)
MIGAEGMPTRRHHQKGNLFVLFDVQFPAPNFFTPSNIDALKKLLPWDAEQPSNAQIKDALPVNVSSVTDRDIRDLEQESGGRDHDEDEHMHGERVQCGQQ